jgi:uncharacterized membrane protein
VKNSPTLLWFLVALAAAAVFMIHTGSALPDPVATHFGPAGTPNGYMSRSFYVRLMLAFVVLLPLGINLLVGRVLSLPNARINIPNRDYWLAAERREHSVRRLQRHMQFFGTVLAAFLCYMHWQVVQANARSPAQLDNTRFAMGLATFLVTLVVWTVVLRRQFRPPPT